MRRAALVPMRSAQMMLNVKIKVITAKIIPIITPIWSEKTGNIFFINDPFSVLYIVDVEFHHYTLIC